MLNCNLIIKQTNSLSSCKAAARMYTVWLQEVIISNHKTELHSGALAQLVIRTSCCVLSVVKLTNGITKTFWMQESIKLYRRLSI